MESSIVMEISELDEELVKNAIKQKPRSLSFVIQEARSSPEVSQPRLAAVKDSLSSARLLQNDQITQSGPTTQTERSLLAAFQS